MNTHLGPVMSESRFFSNSMRPYFDRNGVPSITPGPNDALITVKVPSYEALPIFIVVWTVPSVSHCRPSKSRTFGAMPDGFLICRSCFVHSSSVNVQTLAPQSIRADPFSPES